MSRMSTALFVLLGLFGAGCCAPAVKPGANLSEHFAPAPPIEMPKLPTRAELEGTACNSGVNGPFAQVLTTNAAGMLSELDLGIQRGFISPTDKPSTQESVIIEIRTCEAGKPSDDRQSLKFRGMLPFAALPPAGRTEGGMLRLNLNPSHIVVAKGEQLAVVVSTRSKDPGQGMFIQFQGVQGHSYIGGDFFRFEGGAWQADHDFVQMQVRLLANTEASTRGSTAQPPPLSTQPVNIQLLAPAELHGGNVIAECAPHPRPRIHPMTRPTVAGTWQFRTHVFNQDGSWYLEFTAFNGTNQLRSPFPMQRNPISVSMARYGDSRGRVVYPPRPMQNFDFMNQPAPMPGPGEGWVRQFKLADAKPSLAAGKYLVTIIVPPEYSNEAITTSFTVP